jgi:hypothetical protein
MWRQITYGYVCHLIQSRVVAIMYSYVLMKFRGKYESRNESAKKY